MPPSFLLIRRILQRPLVALPLAVFALYALYLPFAGYRVQYFDSYVYWTLAKRFQRHGGFSILYFDSALRGYFWALLLLAYRGGLAVVRLGALSFIPMGAALAAALWGWALPALWRTMQAAAAVSKPGDAPALPATPRWRHMVLVGLGFAFWRDYFYFALSDVPGMLALLTSLLLVFWTATKRLPFGWAALAGILAFAAANIRPVFLLNAGLLLAVAAWEWKRAHGVAAAAVRLLLFGLGASLVLTPQWLINRHQFHSNTPLVLGWVDDTVHRSLYLDQLGWGLGTQRYETSIAPNLPNQMIYADPSGQAVLDQEGIFSQVGSVRGGFKSWGEMLGVLGRHWWALVPLYARHLFNGLDLRQPTLYLGPLGPASLPLMALNYTVWFALGLLLWRGRLRRQLHGRRTLLILLVLLAPCALVVPTAIEPRFLLPVHLLAYTTLAYGWPATWTLPKFARHPQRWVLLGAYVLFLIGCFALATNIYSHLRGWPPLAQVLGN